MPNNTAHTAKTIKFSSIGPPGGGGGPANGTGSGAGVLAKMPETVIKAMQHAKKILFFIFISLNLPRQVVLN